MQVLGKTEGSLRFSNAWMSDINTRVRGGSKAKSFYGVPPITASVTKAGGNKIEAGMNVKGFVVIITVQLYFATLLQAKPETFAIRMLKDGRVFDEDVAIDVAKQTATFHVPSREATDEANVIHDFRKNLKIISLPEKKVCFVSQLNKDLPRPVELIHSFKKAATKRSHSILRRVKPAMEIKEVVDDRSRLHRAVGDTCQKFLNYRTEPALHGSYSAITPLSLQRGKNKNRVHRSNCSSSVCYTVDVCYLRCPSSSCLECKEETICDAIDC